MSFDLWNRARSGLGAAALVAMALHLGACAHEPAAEGSAQAAASYEILEANARLPFSRTAVRGFRAGEDRSLLIESVRGDWYRAELGAPCAHDLDFEYQVGLDTGRGGDTLDRFSHVIVNGQRCPLHTFDRIADPDAEPEAEPAATP